MTLCQREKKSPALYQTMDRVKIFFLLLQLVLFALMAASVSAANKAGYTSVYQISAAQIAVAVVSLFVVLYTWGACARCGQN